MARTITSTCMEALASKVRTPALSLLVEDAFDGPDAVSFSPSASGRSSLCRLPTGAYVRAYVDQPEIGTDAHVCSQLVTAPIDASQWATYTVRTDNAQGQAGTAVAIFDSAIFLFYQRNDGVVCFQSSADGVSWSGETVAFEVEGRVWALASSGNDDLFVAVDHDPASSETQDVSLFTWSDSAWSAVSMCSNIPVRVTGMSAVCQDEVFRLALGAQSRPGGGQALCTMTYGAGSWSERTAIHPLDDPLIGLSAPFPGLTVSDGTCRIASVLYDSGSNSGVPRSTCEMWISCDFTHWYLEQILPQSFSYGANIVAGSNDGWIVADAGTTVLSTLSAGTRPAPLDVSDRVTRMTIREPANQIANAECTLANGDGGLSSEDVARTLRVGARITLGLGYTEDTTHTHTFYVDSLRSTKTAGGGNIVLRLSNRGRLLKREVAVDRLYSGQVLSSLVAEVAVNGGIPAVPVSPGTTQFGETLDAFCLGAGMTWENALERLRTLYGFDWFLNESETLQLREVNRLDGASWVYEQDELSVCSVQDRTYANALEVIGAGTMSGSPMVFGQAIDGDAVSRHGCVSLRRVADRLLTSPAQCNIRAALDLRRAQRSGTAGHIRIPLNPSHELLDVLELSDDGSTRQVRIKQLDWTVDFQNGQFDQTVFIEGV